MTSGSRSSSTLDTSCDEVRSIIRAAATDQGAAEALNLLTPGPFIWTAAKIKLTFYKYISMTQNIDMINKYTNVFGTVNYHNVM